MVVVTGLKMNALDNMTFTGWAQETISGGQMVKGAADNDVVADGGFSDLADGELSVLLVNAAADDELVLGIALVTATSGNPITIATRGQYITNAQDAVTVGVAISASNDDDAFANSVTGITDGEEEFAIGKALTGASASGKQLVIHLNV